MTKKGKLELTWMGKDEYPQLEPRILIGRPEMSYGDSCAPNRLVFGDNLLALKALEQEFLGRIKCIYIDPPFNTGQALEHYEDGLEHSIWLSLMRDRLVLLHRLLADSGTLFVHIDDNELGYAIVLLDEIFGRANRSSVITFKQGSATGHKAINPGAVSTTNYILLYAKNKAEWTPNRIFTSRERDSRYGQFISNVEADSSKWKIITLVRAFATDRAMSEKDARTFIKEFPAELDKFVLDNAKSVIRFARPDYESVSGEAKRLIDQSKNDKSTVFRLVRDGYSDILLLGGERILFYQDKLKLIDGSWVAGEPLTTLWDDVLSNNLHNEGGVDFPKGKKPEALLKRVFELTTQPGDWVLDSFAGSGTTGAVAHKMGRKWIMVELGAHCHTHILPRLRRVVDGSDDGGVTAAVGWKGGGGFRYQELAPSLLQRDKYGNWVISAVYDAGMLAAAMCKHEGFVYDPSETTYWKQGRSTERDYILTTTQRVTHRMLDDISDEMKPDETLLICCPAFAVKPGDFPRITLKKIPKAVLHRCEFGRDDYSLHITETPEERPPAKPAEAAKSKRKAKGVRPGVTLAEFGQE